MKIMLVDDSRTMRNIQRNVLMKLGYDDFMEAGDGMEALAQIQATQPDLILLDWNMPQLNGYEMLQKARAAGFTMPIIMVTTEAEKQNVIKALQAGANNYVIKPFTPEALSEKVTQTMERCAAAAAG